MPSNHLILCHPLLLPPSIFPSIRVFSNESFLCIRWPKDWSFSLSIHPCSKIAAKLSSWWTGRTWKGEFLLNPWWWLSWSSEGCESKGKRFQGALGCCSPSREFLAGSTATASIRACDSPGPQFPSGGCSVSLHSTSTSSYKAPHMALVCGTGPSPDFQSG